MLFHVHICLVVIARNGQRNDNDQSDQSRPFRSDGAVGTSLLYDDWYQPVGEARAIGYLLLSSKSELRFGTYDFVSDYGCPHPGMPLCRKQSRRSRDAPIVELAPTLRWALKELLQVYASYILASSNCTFCHSPRSIAERICTGVRPSFVCW